MAKARFRDIRSIICLLGTVSALAGAQPSISNITNAALPQLDTPPDQIYLASRSIATIWGTDLADSTVAIAPPWQTNLGGTEVHLVVSNIYGSIEETCSGECEFVTQLLFVSPTQINFLTPYLQPGFEDTTRVVLIRDGVRYDNHYDLSPLGPGLVTISSGCDADCSVVFQVGYDCLYSFSTAGSTKCGLSWNQASNRVPLGAITDASGVLISSSNPVHQGQIIVLWMTGLQGLIQNSTGAYVQPNPGQIGFGVSRSGQEILATTGYSPNGGYSGAFFTPVPLFAGESPQYPGLDQVNVQFPTCPSKTKAVSEARYDAWLPYASFVTGTTERIYIPFEVRPGDVDCLWPPN